MIQAPGNPLSKAIHYKTKKCFINYLVRVKHFLKLYCSTKMKHLSYKSGCGICIVSIYKY